MYDFGIWALHGLSLNLVFRDIVSGVVVFLNAVVLSLRASFHYHKKVNMAVVACRLPLRRSRYGEAHFLGDCFGGFKRWVESK